MEVLSYLINKELCEGQWEPFKINNVEFSHLLFADDVLLFSSMDKNSLLAINRCLSTFFSSSGLSLNVDKSSLWFSKNTHPDDIAAAESILGIRAVNSLGNYLGYPLGIGSKVRDFKIMKDKILAKFEMWKSKHLSAAGKLTLINSVIVPTASYLMQFFLFPKFVCYAIDKAVRDFLWDDLNGLKKIHLVGWERICKSKESGGLGIPSFFHRNVAFLIKLCWRAFHSQTEPWAVICNHRLSLKSCTSSILGKSLYIGNFALKDHSFNIINSGNSSFWNDHWCHLGMIRSIIQGPLLPQESELSVADLCIAPRTWNWSSLSFSLPNHIVDSIISTPVNLCSNKPERCGLLALMVNSIYKMHTLLL